MRRTAAALAILSSVLVGSPALAARIGLDDRNYQELNDLMASGSDFDELRALIVGLGHEIVPVSSFDAASLAAANISALYLSQPFAQSSTGYSASEITAIQNFVAAGNGLVLHAEDGFGVELASLDSLASAFGVSFAATGSEDDGYEIVSFNAHPVTAGLGPLPGSGYCLDNQRVLTMASPALDLTTLGAPLLPAEDAIAAIGTVAGAPGNVVLLSDTSGFKDVGVSFDVDIDCGGNRVLAANIVNFVVPIPEPGTFTLVAIGLVGLGSRRIRRSRAAGIAWIACALALGAAVAQPARAACTGTTAQCEDGAFGNPFEEPTLLGLPTTERCVEDQEGELRCKVTAGTLVALPDDRFLYWNALEGTENVEVSLVAEFGYVTTNDQSRLLTLAPGSDAPTWAHPSPEDGGAVSNPDGIGPCDPDNTDGQPPDNGGADAALFCSDQKMLYDGRVLAAGGTDYYDDTCVDWNATLPPGITPFPVGSTELEGIKNARIFDPATNEWTQTDSMEFGRWYPAAVTLPNGDIFIASGVTRLVKPVYPDAPMASGRNVVQTETYDTACGTWSTNPATAERSLPLFPRMHLLPNGHVLFNAAGQAFNPFGQAYDQSLWNLVASYDPATKIWTDHAIAGFPGLTAEDLTDPDVLMAVEGEGFRGSTFSVMLTLKPDVLGNHTSASFLTAGGVLSHIVNPSPGGYMATNLSRVDTLSNLGTVPVYSSTPTGPLAAPRWYGTGTLLPNGQVLATSGADRDEVWVPGEEVPVMQAELFDPATNTWTPVALQHNKRTYHNTAVPMRDGRVLVGGHSPITNSYMSFAFPPVTGPGNVGRDPSFEIYSPWYVFRNDRPVITGVSTTSLTNGVPFTATVAGASNLHSIVLMKRTALTHLVDGDQRLVELKVLSTNPLNPAQRTLAVPSSNVLPPGKYVLYANINTSDGVVPSKGMAMTVGAGVVGACN